MEHWIAKITAIDLGAWGPAVATAVRIALILVATWIALAVANRMIRLLRVRIASRFEEPEQIRRAETIGRVLRYIASGVISLTTGPNSCDVGTSPDLTCSANARMK